MRAIGKPSIRWGRSRTTKLRATISTCRFRRQVRRERRASSVAASGARGAHACRPRVRSLREHGHQQGGGEQRGERKPNLKLREPAARMTQGRRTDALHCRIMTFASRLSLWLARCTVPFHCSGLWCIRLCERWRTRGRRAYALHPAGVGRIHRHRLPVDVAISLRPLLYELVCLGARGHLFPRWGFDLPCGV